MMDVVRKNIAAERERFSWGAMCDRIEEVYAMTKG